MGGTCSFFLEKKKEPKKNRFWLSFVLVAFIRRRGYGLFMREAACGYGFKQIFRYESAAFSMFYYSWLPRFVIWSVLVYRESGLLV